MSSEMSGARHAFGSFRRSDGYLRRPAGREREPNGACRYYCSSCGSQQQATRRLVCPPRAKEKITFDIFPFKTTDSYGLGVRKRTPFRHDFRLLSSSSSFFFFPDCSGVFLFIYFYDYLVFYLFIFYRDRKMRGKWKVGRSAAR